MRVTDQMLFELSSRYGGQARSRVERATVQASSGIRVNHPGDDPGAAGLLVQGRAAIDRYDAIATAAGRASDELTAAEGALSSVSNGLVRARELTMQLVNPVYTAEQRAAAAGEVDQILQQVLAQLNTRVGDRFVFGGNRDGSEAFDPAGAYLGDTGVRKVEVAPGVWSEASVRADVAMKGVDPVTGLQTGTDVLATLQSLATALRANDPTGIRAALDPLDRAFSQLGALRTQVGEAQGALDTAVAVSQAARDGERARTAHLGEADIIQAATDLAMAQRALEASLTATAQGFQLTLLRFLK
jgi:flagellar hook-associated protein 3 FlgL